MSLLNYPKFKAFGTASTTPGPGLPLAGGLLNTYKAGTVNTPQSAYTDVLCTVPAANPIVLDTNGEAAIYFKGNYKLVLTDANAVTIWTLDNVGGIGSTGAFTSISSYGSNLATAIAAIGSTPTLLLIDVAVTLGADATVPSTCGLMVIPGGSFALNGHNLTHNGPLLVAGRFQWISGTGTTTFGDLITVPDPQWWGGGSTGVTKANATNIIGTFTANSATPDLSGLLPVYKTNNSQLTTFTSFLNMTKNHEFKIIVSDVYTDLKGATIKAPGGLLASGMVLDCVTDGTNVYVIASSGVNVQVFTASGTWTKPAGAKIVVVECVGAGGGGGGGGNAASANVKSGGGGGGGGAFITKTFNATNIPSTAVVTVGTGGTGGASATIGIVGGYSLFGNNPTALIAYGGSPGNAGTIGAAKVTGGNGGSSENINVVAASCPNNGQLALGTSGGAGDDGTGNLISNAENGGSGGGGVNGAQVLTNTITSYRGGGGGGSGGPVNTTGATAYAGQPGSNTGPAGGFLAGGLGGTTSGNTGGNGAAGTAYCCGSGGGGGGGATIVSGGTGGAGGAPGGGGGGGGGVHAASGGGIGGAGARGEVRVYTYF